MKKGIMLSVLTAVVSGCSILANSIFVSKTDPLIFSLVRNAIVALALTGILLAVGHVRQLSGLSRRQWSLLILIGIVGGGIPFALFFTGLSEIGALNGNLIQKTLFLWVAILAVPILHERISKIQLLGYGVLFIGMFVLGGTGSVANKTGTWLILTATILWAIENVIAKIALRSMPSTIVSWGRMVFGLPCLLIAVAAVGKMGLLSQTASYNPTALVVSSMFLVVYVTLWYSALAKAPATLVSSVLVFAPVITAMLTGVLLHKPSPQPIVNLLLLTLGTVLVILERVLPKRQQQPV